MRISQRAEERFHITLALIWSISTYSASPGNREFTIFRLAVVQQKLPGRQQIRPEPPKYRILRAHARAGVTPAKIKIQKAM